MEVIKKGAGEPELVVVGSVHGDEPAGKKAIKRVLENHEKFLKPVKFIIANEEALEKGERYVEADLNSSFSGDPDSDKREERLAARIAEHVKGKKVLDLHTTHSTEKPFANVKNFEQDTLQLLKHSGVDNSACFPEQTGVLIEMASTGVLVETGPQGTENAVEDAEKVLENFLACQGVIEGECVQNKPDLFRHFDTVEGDWVFEAENFQKVEQGEVYATRENEELEAEEEFYPVLMSTNGYEGKLGYKAEKVDRNF